jgi:hypothetical protein
MSTINEPPDLPEPSYLWSPQMFSTLSNELGALDIKDDNNIRIIRNVVGLILAVMIEVRNELTYLRDKVQS